jgi:hypothetical protein
VSKQRTHARAHALVGWLSGRLDLSVRPCRRARGVAGVGVVYHVHFFIKQSIHQYLASNYVPAICPATFTNQVLTLVMLRNKPVLVDILKKN